jgi:hypothetical protein
MTDGAKPRSSLGGAVATLAGGPARLALVTWVVTFTAYALVPLHYADGVRPWTLSFAGACVLSVIAGAALVAVAHAACGPSTPASVAILPIEPSLRLLASLGIVGAALVMIDKLLITGLDLSQGLGNLRFVLQAEEEIFKERSPALWLGSLLYSFGDVALVVYMFEGDRVRRSTAILVLLASLAPVSVVLLYGGRSSALILLVLAAGACLVRLASEQSALPRARYLRGFLVSFTILAVAGSFYIFADRAAAFRQGWTTVDALNSFLDQSAIQLAPWTEALVTRRDEVSPYAADILIGIIYLTHPLAELDYLLHENTDAGPFLGEYQGWLVSKGLRLAVGSPDATDEIEGMIHHSGLFFTGWGAMVLDFGPWGALFLLFILGLVGGGLYVAGVKQKSLPGRLLLTYFYMIVLASPIHSGFALGNSTQVLLCSLLACPLLRTRRARLEGPPNSEP